MKFPNGTSVKVVSKYSENGRTGVVIDDALKFPWRDSRAVKFDAPFAGCKPSYIPLSESRAPAVSRRLFELASGTSTMAGWSM